MVHPISMQAHELDLTRWIQPNDRIFLSQGVGEPTSLVERLTSQRSAIGQVRLFLTVSFRSTIRAHHQDYFSIEGLGGSGVYHHLSQLGIMDPHPAHLSYICNNIALGVMPIDVAMVQLAGPDEDGHYSAGIDHTYTHDIVRQARVVIAEVHTAAPITPGVGSISPKQLDVIVHSSRSLPTISAPDLDRVDHEIAEVVANIVSDEAILQVGIDTLPSAILGSLHSHRNIGIHTGMLSSSTLKLMSSGAVTNATKKADTGHSSASSLVLRHGELNTINGYALIMRPARQILDLRTLAAIPKFTAINSALQVDLTGQVNAEYANARYVGEVGGLVDFVRGSRASTGGVSITALRSRRTDGASNIVPRLAGGVVTLGRSDVDVVVTEWGAAHLSNMSLTQRARSLISIAHPDDRSRLTDDWGSTIQIDVDR